MPFSNHATIEGNANLRTPQRGAWAAIRDHFASESAQREVGIVLPVGCGKSGLIALSPFATVAKRCLIVAPGLRIRDQLAGDLKSSSNKNFYELRKVLAADSEFPETATVASGRVNLDDLEHSDIVVANIQQLVGDGNQWLSKLPHDFFDLILVDEGHHNPADSWRRVKAHFPAAKVINYSATPTRADGQVMDGAIIYSFPVISAIEEGFVKRLRAKMLSPTQLKYIDRTDGKERVIGPAEVLALGEEDAGFRRGIVMADETLASIVDCAKAELERIRKQTGNVHHKIIASALNQAHCIQIVQAFRERGLKAEYVHSNESQAKNTSILKKLENHEIDAIVQARMLGEGFDHPLLSVAMVGSLFTNLSPFVQFVGRVMRAVHSGNPSDPNNQGVVVFHAGANVAKRWSDFRSFSRADQTYFAELLPEVETVEFAGSEPIERIPGTAGVIPVDVLEERDVRAAELEPLGDPQLAGAIRMLAERGVTPEQYAEAFRRTRINRQDMREARRASLNDRVMNESGRILAACKLKAAGRTLDKARRQDDRKWLIAQLNLRIAEAVGRRSGERQDYSLEELDLAHLQLPGLAEALEREVRNA